MLSGPLLRTHLVHVVVKSSYVYWSGHHLLPWIRTLIPHFSKPRMAVSHLFISARAAPTHFVIRMRLCPTGIVLLTYLSRLLCMCPFCRRSLMDLNSLSKHTSRGCSKLVQPGGTRTSDVWVSPLSSSLTISVVCALWTSAIRSFGWSVSVLNGCFHMYRH